MIEFKEERFDECVEEIKPLLEKHYEEIAMYKDKIKLAPDYSKYKQMDEAGILNIVTVRDDGRLVGYFISFILPHPHYSNNVYANNDIVYLDKEYREAKVGLGLFKFTEEVLKGKGVDVIMIHMKTAVPFDSLCEGLNYDYAERLYTKYIGDL